MEEEKADFSKKVFTKKVVESLQPFFKKKKEIMNIWGFTESWFTGSFG
jgi:hypothetical protein